MAMAVTLMMMTMVWIELTMKDNGIDTGKGGGDIGMDAPSYLNALDLPECASLQTLSCSTLMASNKST